MSLCGSILKDDSEMFIQIPSHVTSSEGGLSVTLLMGRPRDERRIYNS